MKNIPMVFFYRQVEMKSEERQKLLDEVFEIIFNSIYREELVKRQLRGVKALNEK